MPNTLFKKPEFSENLSGEDLKRFLEKKQGAYVVVDVRERDEYNENHIRRAHLLPISELQNPNYTSSIDASQIALVHCRSGRRTEINKEAIKGSLRKLGVTEIHFVSEGISAVALDQLLSCYLPVVQSAPAK